jgi:cytidylate kinase
MTSDFIKYMSKRVPKGDQVLKKEAGPVITLSREFGCPSKELAKMLNDSLNSELQEKKKKPIWKWISKEILEETAKELNLDPSQIEYVFKYEKKSFIDEIISSQTKKYYKSDKKIRNTIGEVIRSIAEKGNVIIVGRGGVAITKDIPQSLHIKLEAPMEWRTLLVSEKYNLDFNKAREYTIEMDTKRSEFRNYFYGQDNDYTAFDAKFNCMTLTNSEITKSILGLAKLRNFV